MVDSFLQIFNQFKVILCMCPNCNNLSRLSDLHLRTKEKAPKTWLDDYELNAEELVQREEKFRGDEAEIREKAAQRGRTQVPKIIRKSMDENFAKLKYDPYDIKAILHPIDFVVFDGMDKEEMKNVILLGKQTTNPHLQDIQRKIVNAVENKQYDWKVVRVATGGTIEIK